MFYSHIVCYALLRRVADRYRILAVAITLLIFLFHPGSSCAEERQEVRIGAIVPLTGGLAGRGDDIAKLLQILEPQLNSKSTRYRYRFLLEDGKCGAGSAATTAAKKFIEHDKVHFLITGCSGETLQVGPLAQRAKVVTFAVISNHHGVRELGNFIFRTFVDIEDAIVGFSNYVKQRVPGNIVVLTEENAFTLGMKDLLQANLGNTIVLAEDFTADTGDVSTLLLRAKATGAAALYLNVMSEGTLLKLVRDARALKLSTKMYTYLMPEALSFREAIGDQGAGIEFIGSPDIREASSDYREVFRQYLEQHPKGPSFEFVLRTTYDAVKALVAGIEAVGPDSEKVSKFLSTYKAHGALGKIEFDDAGDIKHVRHTLRRIREDGTSEIVTTLGM